MNPKMVKAQIAMLKVQEKALRLGYLVSIPTIEGMRYDCLIDTGKEILRAQVKYSAAKLSQASGVVNVHLCQFKGRGVGTGYTSKEIDVLLLYLPDADMVCALWPDVFEGKKSLTIRYQAPRNGQMKGCRMAKDFEWK